MKTKQKVILILSSSILSILTLITACLCIAAMDKKVFTVESIKGDNYITAFKQGETLYHNKDVAPKYGLDLEDEESDEPKIIFNSGTKIKIEISKLQNLGLFFELEENKGEIKVSYDGNSKIYKSTNNNTLDQFFYSGSMTGILLEELSDFNIANYLLIFILAVALTFIYAFLLYKLVNILIKVKNKEDLKLREIIYMSLIYFYFNIAAMLPIIEIMHKLYCIIIILQVIGILYYLKDSIKDKLHNIFAVLAIIFSVNMLILLPAFHVPDEFAHYIKAYSIFHEDEVEINDYMPTINISDTMYENFYKYNCDFHNPNYKTTIKEYFVDLTTTDSGAKTNPVKFYNTYSIRNFAYIPSSIVINLVLAFNLPIMLSALLARLVNALIFILLGYLALKIIPHYKRILFTMMLLPITIQQTAAVNQDSITLSIIFIFVAIVFKEIYSKEKYLSNKTLLLILMLSAFLGLAKPGYFFITLLTLLIPKERFKNKKICYITRFIPVLLCGFLTASKYLNQFELAGEAVEKIDDAVTVGYILRNPMFLIKICFYTFYKRGSLDLLTGQLNLFGWSTVLYDFLASYVIYFLFTFILFFDNEEPKVLKVKNRIYILLIVIATIGLIYASALFGFNTTTINSDMISGLQSRYFIPVTLLLAIGVSNSLLKINIKNKNLFNIIVIALTILVTFYTIMSGFYQ